MRILGLDVGDRRIGLATGDSTGLLATPLRVYQRVGVKRDVAAMIAAGAEHRVDAFLLGMPLSLDGTIGPQAQRVQRFCEAIRSETALPVLTWDERFSTIEADRLMLKAGMTAEKRKALRDAAAAAVILQSYLDSLRAVSGLASTKESQ